MVELLGHALEVAGEPVGVAGVAEHPRLLQPVRGEQPLLVEAVQVVGAFGVRRRRQLDEPLQQRLGHLRVGVDHRRPRRRRSGHQRSSRSCERLAPVAAEPTGADERVEPERALEPSWRRRACICRGAPTRCIQAHARRPSLRCVPCARRRSAAAARAGRRCWSRLRARGRRDRCRPTTPNRPPTTPSSTTPLEDFDTSTVVVRRGRRSATAIDPRQVEAALGAGGAGRRVVVRTATGSRCRTASATWSTSSAASTSPPTARSPAAWVFAPPVEARRARRTWSRAAAAAGCQVVGRAGLRRPARCSCTACARTSTSDGYSGLFGDAWLSCQLGPSRPLTSRWTWTTSDRAGRWCVGVALAAG